MYGPPHDCKKKLKEESQSEHADSRQVVVRSVVVGGVDGEAEAAVVVGGVAGEEVPGAAVVLPLTAAGTPTLAKNGLGWGTRAVVAGI